MSDTNTTIDPSTGAELATYDVDGVDTVRKQVLDAHEAFKDWSMRPVEERAAVAGRIGELLRERRDDLSELMSREMGKLVSQSKSEIDLCADICEWTAEHAAEELADEDRDLPGGRAIVSYRPEGVILGIQPWNFPIYQALRYSIPNLAAGNTVLLKHARSVWGSAIALAEIYHEAGVPPAAFQVLKTGHEAVAEIMGMREIRGVTLTGSDGAGRKIGANAAENLKKTVLELGSNDAYIVLADADIDRTVKTCVTARTFNNGETCVAGKRFIVEDAVYDEFRDKFVERMGNLVAGSPFDEASDIGPMAREDLRDELHEQVTKSVEAGATIAVGGEIPEGDGYYYPATVLEDLAPGMPAYDDELFGPVASLIRASDAEEAMRIANDSRYGLGGGIFSGDTERAIELARDHFDTGMVNINTYRLAQPNLPFGGVKDSGYGREHGGFGIKEFVNVKAIMIKE